MTAEGFEVIERREPSLLADSCSLITGEIDRTTEFEHGMPPSHQAWTGEGWLADPLAALSALGPGLISAGHSTGWRAQNALAAALPDAWVPGSSGTTHHLTGA